MLQTTDIRQTDGRYRRQHSERELTATLYG